MTRSTIIATFALLVALPSAKADKLDDAVRAEMKKEGIPGVSLAVVKDGRVVKASGYGFAELENHVPATPRSVYEIASLSKQFTATALMMLVEEGKVSLDDPVSKYLPNTPDTWSTMRVSNLLNHTAGFSYLIVDPAKLSAVSFLRYTRSELLADIEKSKLMFAPGEKMFYSNMGYELAAMIVEKVSGEKFSQFLQSRIFDPLAMKSTDTADGTAVVDNRAGGYTWRAKKLAIWRMFGTLGAMDLNGFGGLESNVLDLAKWEAAQEQGSLLKPESWQTLWTPGKLNNGQTVADYDGPYGYGWHVNDLPYGHVLEHTGYTGTAMLRIPSKKLAVIVLTNLGDGNPKPFSNDHGFDVKTFGRELLELANQKYN
jgi:CubicO group peptidase (beta-lactamase class C family)